MTAPVIRPLESLEELRAAAALQAEIWGATFSERVPPSLLSIGARLGGVSAGAFDGEDGMVGFVFGLTGLEEGRPVHWSHMLAVLPGHGGRGLGLRLKAYQRERLLERGVTRAYWTFDPMESRNAWLNLGKLGGVASRYRVDLYGDTDSPRHGRLGTDRFVVVWEMDSGRVRERLAAAPSPRAAADLGSAPAAFEVEVVDGLPRPVGACEGGSGDATRGARRIPRERPFLVPIPRDLQGILARSPEVARAWREATRAILRPALDGGDVVRELVTVDEHTSALVVEET